MSDVNRWFARDPVKLLPTAQVEVVLACDYNALNSRCKAMEDLLMSAMPIAGPADEYDSWDEWHNKREALFPRLRRSDSPPTPAPKPAGEKHG